ncbi:hypothetical protein L7F22_005611 [Adiantum nelumboides]|nr:hypothetical protein [Adiantum nelumboides]
MSLRGAGSVRRGRASHSRPASPHLRLYNPSPCSGIHQEEEHDDHDGLHGRAMAARRRLDERLHTARGLPMSCTAKLAAVFRPTWLSSTDHRRDPNGRSVKRLLREGNKPTAVVMAGHAYDNAEEECSICLDSFLAGGHLVMSCLPCYHRFHTACLLPWLQAHSQCPLCRATIISV